MFDLMHSPCAPGEMYAQNLAGLDAPFRGVWHAMLAGREKTIELADLIAFILVTPELARPLANSSLFRGAMILAAANGVLVPLDSSWPACVPGAATFRPLFFGLCEIGAVVAAALVAIAIGQPDWLAPRDEPDAARIERLAARRHGIRAFRAWTFGLGAIVFLFARLFALWTPSSG